MKASICILVQLVHTNLASAALPAAGNSLMQSRLRGSRTTVESTDKDAEVVTADAETKSFPAQSPTNPKTLFGGQRYSDDDESCSAEGITPGVCALASLARPPPVAVASEGAGADCDKKESAERLERALIAEIESALAGNHTGFDESRLQALKQELEPLFETLPHEMAASEGGLGLPSARYLLHQHFLRQHHWYVRGLDPAGDSRKPPNDKEALRSRVAGHLLEVLENKVGKKGLNLECLAVFVATLEHLLHGDQRERLKQSWNIHSLQPESTTDASGLASVLEVFMAHYVYVGFSSENGYAMSLQDGLREVKTISRIYAPWSDIQSSVQQQVEKRIHLSGSSLSFEDAAQAADSVLLYFNEASGSMCHDMEKTFFSLPGGETGRVKLQDLRNNGGGLFRESEQYLQELGALDDADPKESYVYLANYMLGPSNCDGTTSFYDLCCPNECESHKMHLEHAVAHSSDAITSITEVVTRRLGAPIASDALARLKDIANAGTGNFPIHGLSFAAWLHTMFPQECPKPRSADFNGMDGGAVPDAKQDFQATAQYSFTEW